MKYLITISAILIMFLGCTDKEKDFIPTSITYNIENNTNYSIEIKSFRLSIYVESDFINPLQTTSLTGTNGDPSDGIYIPSYVSADSVLLIFNNEKFINYQRNGLTSNYINQKNIIDLESWQKENLSTNKLRKFIYTFQITEEDYALAEDL